jgi:hypothetical protein
LAVLWHFTATMMKYIAIVTLAAFALLPSLTAGEGKCCDKNKAEQQEKGCCPAGKKGCCPKDSGGKKECPAKEKAPEKAPQTK